MTIFPILERELIVAARRPATHRTRIAAATLAILSTFFLILTGTTGSQGAGGALFAVMSTCAFIFAAACGIFLSADVISHECREGTLGLLFLTDLDGIDIILGKMLACGLNAFYGLLAVLPVLATSWFLGGVTGGEFIRIAAVLFNSLLLSIALGLWVSTRATAEIQAIGHTAAWICSITLVPFLLAWIPQVVPMGPKTQSLLVHGVFAWSPLTAFMAGSDLKYHLSTPLYWTSMSLVHALTWGFLIHAAHRLRTGWREGTEASKSAGSDQSKLLVANEPDAERERRRRERDKNPVAVLIETDVRIQRFAWVCVIAGFLIQASLIKLGAPSSFMWGLFSLILFPMKVLIAWKACSFFASARREGTMELLLTTPLTDFEIIEGQMQGLKRLFQKPILVLALGSFVLPLLLLSANSVLGKNSSSISDYFEGAVGVIVFGAYYWLVWVVDVRALHWVGFWLALTEPRPGIAFAKTLLRIVVIPTILVCIPNIVINGFQLSWARDKFRMNLRAILQGARNPWPLYPVARE